jgi:hypothetical protein
MTVEVKSRPNFADGAYQSDAISPRCCYRGELTLTATPTSC